MLKIYTPTTPPHFNSEEILKLEGDNPIMLQEELNAGIEFDGFRALAKALEISEEKLGLLIGLNKTAISRRRRQERLNANESEAIYRIARTLERSRDVIGRDALEWLNETTLALGNRRPLEVAASGSVGGELVLNLIGQLEDGVYP